MREPSRKVAAGERFTIALPEPDDPEPKGEAIPLDILYEDADLIVINKPAGLVVHPGAGNWTGTLVNALIHHCGDSLSGIGGVRRPGIVHRLDKDTSGVMVVAKNDQAHRALSASFADHGRTGELERDYDALVWGVPARNAGTIDAPLGRDPRPRRCAPWCRGSRRRAPRGHALRACRSVSGRGRGVASLLACRLETGRTHQIRVHMAHIGHPADRRSRSTARRFRTKANRLPEPLRDRRDRLSAPGAACPAACIPASADPYPGDGFEAPIPRDMRDLIDGFGNL